MKISNNKAPGLTGVTTNMQKNISDKALIHIQPHPQLLEQSQNHFQSWHLSKLSTL